MFCIKDVSLPYIDCELRKKYENINSDKFEMDKNLKDNENIDVQKHKAFLKAWIEDLPEELISVECHKIFNLYFILTGLDMINSLDEVEVPKEKLIEYIYSNQCQPSASSTEKKNFEHNFGFFGGPYLGFDSFQKNEDSLDRKNEYYTGNLVYTFPAICCLLILGDDLSRVDKSAIAQGMSLLQNEVGCFRASIVTIEYDIRFIYAACCISYLIGDWSGINIEKASRYIESCQNGDYAFGFTSNSESHAASTYLAIASLSMMNQEKIIRNRNQLIEWCLKRQVGGFQGRVNKFPDSCYSFWLGATLELLGFISHAFNFLDASELVDEKSLSEFLFTCESKYGGFCKFPDSDFPDPVHTLHSLMGLSFLKKFKNLNNTKALLSMSVDTFNKWEQRCKK